VCINSDVLDRNGTTSFHRNEVLVKNGGSAHFSRAGRFPVQDDSDSDDSTSSSSSEGVNEKPEESECAYLMCEVIHEAIYGKVYHGIILRRSSSTDVWHMTNEECAIKAMTWDQIRAGRERHLIENPQDEISAMQHLKRRLDDTRGRNIPVDEAMRESNVIMSLDFLFDDRNLYTITPYCRGGELFDVLLERERERYTEPESRYLLSSISVGLESLQWVDLCH